MKIGKILYFDHQATTPVDSRIFAEMSPYFMQNPGNPHSEDHHLGWQAAQAVEEAAGRVARFIGADDDEIVFTSGATESNNLALLGFARRAAKGNRRRILVSEIEHKCVLAASHALQEQLGYRVEYVPVDNEGRVVVSALEQALDDGVLMVSIMAVNNEIGTIQDIEQISKLITGHGAIFHCDAAQAPCAVDLSSFADFVDLLSLSAHKMYGPKGVGALFIRRELQDQIEPIIYGGGQQHNLRSGTTPVPLCVGMGASANLFGASVAKQERLLVSRRRDQFVKGLLNLQWPVEINGPKNEYRHPGNANIRFIDFSAYDILSALQPGLSASTGAACTSGIQEPSHVLKAIGLSTVESDASIRFSIGRDTSDLDIEEAVDLVGQALSKLSVTNLAKSTQAKR